MAGTSPAMTGLQPADNDRRERSLLRAGRLACGFAHSILPCREKPLMSSFDFAPLLAAGLPAPAAKWTGFPKYNFTGGHNDGEELPLDQIVKAANDVLVREGRTLATYGLESG